MISVSSLCVYPLKSARGVPVDVMELDDRGPRDDRRWMVVDEAATFLSQRRVPALALIQPCLTPEGLLLSAPGTPALAVRRPDDAAGANAIEGRIWDAACRVLVADAAANAWLTRVLGVSARLVYLPDDAVRPNCPDEGGANDAPRAIALADGSPLLLIGQASLDDLNRRLETPVPMDRFRPNIVVAGAAPHAEDDWRRLRIGRVTFEVSGPCTRCAATTIDQETGRRGVEPLRTLSTYRKVGSGVNFGQNLAPLAPGVIRVGDAVEPATGA